MRVAKGPAEGELFQDSRGLTVRVEEVDDGHVHFLVFTKEYSVLSGVMSLDAFENKFTNKIGKPQPRSAA